MSRIVAVCGGKRTGKDTIADYLVEHHGYTKVSIAGKLKELVYPLLGFQSEEEAEEAKDIPMNSSGVTPRRVLRYIGTDSLPERAKRIWVRLMIESMDPEKKYVISDLRFLHEEEELSRFNPFIIQVTRPSSLPEDSHISENEWNLVKPDVRVSNDGSLEDLLEKIESILMSGKKKEYLHGW